MSEPLKERSPEPEASLGEAEEAGRPDPSSPERQLSHGIWRLSKRAGAGSLTLNQALHEIEPAPPLLFCSLLALPFCQPVPTVGLSIPFGLGIASIALTLMLGRKPAVPQWLGRRRIPSQVFPLLLRVTARFLKLTERVLRPRVRWMFLPPLGRVWAAVLILNAVFLSLPLPIPLSNSFPAISILAICLGSLKQDGLTVAAGLGIFAIAIAFLVVLGFAGMAALS